MLTINLLRLCNQIVDHARTSMDEKSAIHINFDVRLSYFIDGEIYGQSCGLHLLYHSRGAGSVSSFSGLTDSPFGKISEVEQWRHECTHDSCWRNVSIFNDLYFDLAAKINGRLEKDGMKSVPPIAMENFITFRSQDSLYQMVQVEVSKDPTDSYGYKRLIKLL